MLVDILITFSIRLILYWKLIAAPLLQLSDYVFAPCGFALPRPPPPSPNHSNVTCLYLLSVTYISCRKIEYMDGRGGGELIKRDETAVAATLWSQ